MRTFTYLLEGYNKMEFPFRIGDVVRVNDFGVTFSTWYEANRYFTGKNDIPFYSSQIGIGKRSFRVPFKIKGIMAHPNQKRVVCYLCDRDGHDIIIGAEALRVIRQYPLRKGESNVIQLKKILD